MSGLTESDSASCPIRWFDKLCSFLFSPSGNSPIKPPRLLVSHVESPLSLQYHESSSPLSVTKFCFDVLRSCP